MIDNIDQGIIQELQRNGRENFVDIAEKLGVVEGTVRNRLNKLLENNILKIVAVPNMLALGYRFVAIMGFQVNMPEMRKVAKELSKNQHICYLAWVTGKYDLMAIIITRSPQELASVIENEFSCIVDILRMETFVNLDILKGAWGVPDTTQLISNLSL